MELLKRLMVNVVEYTLMIGLVVMGIWFAVSVVDIPGAVATWNAVSAELASTAS